MQPHAACDVFQRCLEVARRPAEFSEHRPRHNGIERLTGVRYVQALPDGTYRSHHDVRSLILVVEVQDCVVRFLIGEFHVPLSLVWDDAKQALSTYAQRQLDSFWTVYFEHVKAAVASVDRIDPAETLQADHYHTESVFQDHAQTPHANPVNLVPERQKLDTEIIFQQESQTKNRQVDEMKFHR